MEVKNSRVSSNQLAVVGWVVPLVAAYWLGGYFQSTGVTLGILLVLAAKVIYTYRRILYVLVVTLPRDFKFVNCFARLLITTKRYAREDVSLATIFQNKAARYPDKPCLYFEDQIWTNKDLLLFSNRVAHVFQAAGYRRGDVVALLMENRPEFVGIFLGLAQLGVVTALINTNLRLATLQHSFSVAKPRGVVFSASLATAVGDIKESLSGVDLYEFDATDAKIDAYKSLSQLLSEASESTPQVADPPKFQDKLMYIYTSGTTGLPKAAIILHSRYLTMTSAVTSLVSLRVDDVIYCPLPLYHTAGAVLGIGPTLVMDVATVLRDKFSASAYWTDCIHYKCTAAQYIGEICRYILAVPPRPTDTQHKVRVMYGNGMKTAIWQRFVDRFKVEEIREFYGSTEGNASIVNLDSTVGAVGALPSFIRWTRFTVGLIRVNQETGEPIRGDDGLCIKCGVDDPGMYVGIISPRIQTSQYTGYVDKEASSKKVLHNVFKPGDKAFASGDILIMDEYGYLYFVDRTGDTFRWKGENVSSTEVEAAISDMIGLKDATVYGVEIPGMEGRAGMAAIADPDHTLNLAALAASLEKVLPFYARPVFLRTLGQLDLTGTYKLKKVELQKEGFDPSVVKDKMYFRRGKDYVPLTADLYSEIVSGKERL